MTGDLAWFPVMVAGAIGGAAGDQIWFYLLRGRIHWFDRYPKLAKYRARISDHVHSHETAMILVGRFLPGLRTAIPVACAYANVRPVKFSLLNLVSAFAWAGAIMLLVRGGSRTLSAFGLNAWWGPFIPRRDHRAVLPLAQSTDSTHADVTPGPALFLSACTIRPAQTL